jgi:hypothetical protein
MLRKMLLVLAATFPLVTVSLAAAPSEQELRAADSRQADAARTRNADDLEVMMHPAFMVNSPEGEVWSKEKVIRMWRSRGIGHDSFERTVEQVKITNDIGVVMGHEVVAPSADSVAGQRRHDGAHPVERRFTNIWLWQNNKWWFLARHANEQPGATPAQKK